VRCGSYFKVFCFLLGSCNYYEGTCVLRDLYTQRSRFFFLSFVALALVFSLLPKVNAIGS
jgi:hypothetical protein